MAVSRKPRASWNKLVDDADQPSWVVDAEWRIVLVNSALLAWWGDGGEQLVGQKICYGLAADSERSTDLAAALAPDPQVLSGRELHTTLVHPRDAAQQLAVHWQPMIAANGEIQAAWAWGTRAAPPDQGSPAKIASDTDWHALLAEHQARERARGQAQLSRFVGEGLAMYSLRLLAGRAASLDSPVWIHGPAGSGRRSLARTINALDHFAHAFAELDAATLTPELLQRQLQDLAARIALLPTKPSATQHANLLLANLEQLAESSLELLESFLAKQPIRLLLTSAGSPASFQRQPGWTANRLANWSVQTIEIPPLASRLSDLPDVVQQLIEELNRAGHKQHRGCSLAALELLTAYRWPGDVAELARVIRAAHQAATGIEIQPADLPPWLRQAESALAAPRAAPQPIDLDQQLAQIERELLARALRLAAGNKTQAAKLVGWTRQRLLRRAEELGLVSSAASKIAAQEPEFIPDLPFEPEE